MKKSIYIGAVRMEPKSSREVPYLFGHLVEARQLSHIVGHIVWATLPGEPTVYKCWPGGRILIFEAPEDSGRKP